MHFRNSTGFLAESLHILFLNDSTVSALTSCLHFLSFGHSLSLLVCRQFILSKLSILQLLKTSSRTSPSVWRCLSFIILIRTLISVAMRVVLIDCYLQQEWTNEWSKYICEIKIMSQWKIQIFVLVFENRQHFFRVYCNYWLI
jgi:hypothetical protein